MIRIRLMRMGQRHAPFYRVVVMDSRSAQRSRFIESLGYYNPTKNPQIVELKEDRVRHWLSVGAQPTDTAKSLMRMLASDGSPTAINLLGIMSRLAQSEGRPCRAVGPGEQSLVDERPLLRG